MKPAADFQLVFVTMPDLQVARRLARAALEARLVACANIIPRVESHYWWQGKMERSTEWLVIFKTRRAQVAQLEALLLEAHPYDTPEIIAVALASGNARYLAWISASLQA